MGKRRKIRVDFRKNREKVQRQTDLTRRLRGLDDDAVDRQATTERIRAKGDVSRKRTIVVEGDSDSLALPADCRRGRVLVVKGLQCLVVDDEGNSHRCFIRRLLKTMATDERSAVTTGDWVWFKPAQVGDGAIVRVEPRGTVLTRGYRGREQVIAANVDQVMIVASVIHPDLKANLIDRYIVSAGRGELRPLICVNKIDFAESFRIQPIVGMYAQLGYRVVMTSAAKGIGIERLKAELKDRQTAIVGPSGVGKSSLLNALEPKFVLRVGDISSSSGKGRHTTTSAQLLQLAEGGAVIDTPGMRQFELRGLPADEVEAYFVEVAALAGECRFPGCRHDDEDFCAVRTAVANGFIHYCRYESYLRILHGDG